MGSEKNLSEWRFEQAGQFLKTAKFTIQIDDYKSSANRSYYCIFHCIRSVLALDNIDLKKHSAVIARFREKYIKTGIFDKQLSKIIDELFNVRNASDYDDFYILSKNEAVKQIENAEYFLKQIRKYLYKIQTQINK